MTKLTPDLALVSIASIEYRHPRNPALRDCRIDSPTPGIHLVNGPDSGIFARQASLRTDGWVLGLRHRAVKIVFTTNGAVLKEVPLRVFREDVNLAYPGSLEIRKCGFKSRIALIALASDFDIEVLTELEDGASIIFAHVKGTWKKLPAHLRSSDPVSILASLIQLLAE